MVSQFDNAAAITRNGRLRRMHQPISLIKVLKPSDEPHKFGWASHPQVPKHMKQIYTLGQRAKGVFEPSLDGKPNEMSVCCPFLWEIFGCSLLDIAIYRRNSANADSVETQAKRDALHTINKLANFYNIVIWSDEEGESDATEVLLQDMTVDDYMEALLAEWGMDWQKVLTLGIQHMQAQPQQAGAKRIGDAISTGEKKKR